MKRSIAGMLAVLSTRWGASAVGALVAAPLCALLMHATARQPIVAAFDYGWFGAPGAAMLTGHLDRVYADAGNQGGPFELLPNGIAHLLGVHTAVGWTIDLTIVSALTAFSIVLVLLPAGLGRAAPLFGIGIASLSAALQLSTSSVFGHPADVAVPLLWIAAARLAIRDRPTAAAIVVALSAGFETWGILGAPTVLLASRVRLVRPALAGAAVLAVLYAPFALSGRFAMFQFRWWIVPGTLVSMIRPDLTTFPWTLRIVQATLAVGGGAAIALLLRNRAAGAWLVPLAVESGRMLLDPMVNWYYWDVPRTIALGMLIAGVAGRRLLLVAPAAAILVINTVGTPWDQGVRCVLLALVVAALVVAAASPQGGRVRRLLARTEAAVAEVGSRRIGALGAR